MARVVIEKHSRRLTAYDGAGGILLQCPVALGFSPAGHKAAEGDGRTPEGDYRVCVKRERGKFGRSLGLDYPNLADAKAAASQGHLSPALLPLFEKAHSTQTRPPWGTALGGEIYIHGGGTHGDWTAGCIALSDKDMAALFALVAVGDRVTVTA